jgi:hypothetical protein
VGDGVHRILEARQMRAPEEGIRLPLPHYRTSASSQFTASCRASLLVTPV